VLHNTSCPTNTTCWAYTLPVALLDRGLDVNARCAGLTPLLRVAKVDSPDMAAVGPLLLLERGADIDAVDENGWTSVHWMAHNGMVALMSELTGNGWLLVADLTLRNSAGATALENAQHELVAHPVKARVSACCDLLRATEQLWQTQARPLLLEALSHSLLLPDLAHVVLSYVDGQERAPAQP